MVNVKVENGTVKVESPYNSEWISRARELGGRWKAPCWEFDQTHEQLVRKALMAIYGENGTVVEKVMVDVYLDPETSYEEEIVLAGMTIARRRGRDWPVKMENGAVLVSGGFDASGGSAKYPRIGCPKDNSIIRVSLPKAVLAKAQGDFHLEVVHNTTVSREKLEAERATLLKRLAEIDELLKLV